MSDDHEPWYSPKAKPPPPRVAKPGELLFEFHRERDHKFFRCANYATPVSTASRRNSSKAATSF